MSKAWSVCLIYARGRKYLFRTKDLVRTLRKVAGDDELESVGIKPEFSNPVGLWVWISADLIEHLLKGAEVPVVTTLHPYIDGTAHGSGTTKLTWLLGEDV